MADEGEPVKLCKDCKHYVNVPGGEIFGVWITGAEFCDSPKLKQVSLVHGGLILKPNVNSNPHKQRGPEGGCGPDGEFFEAGKHEATKGAEDGAIWRWKDGK